MDDLTIKLPERKQKRFENKKRKLQCLVDLVQSNTKRSKKQKTEKSLCSIPSNDEQVPESRLESSKPDATSPSDDYKQLKQVKREIHKNRLPIPFIELTQFGTKSLITATDEQRKPLTMLDVKTLMLHTLMPGRFPFPARWGRVAQPKRMSHTVIVNIDGIDVEDFKKCAKKKGTSASVGQSCDNGILEMYNGFNEISDQAKAVPDWLECSLPRTSSSLTPVTFELALDASSKPIEDLLCLPNNNPSWNIVDEEEAGNEQSTALPNGKIKSETEEQLNGVSESEVKTKSKKLPHSDTFDRRRLLLTPSDLVYFKFPIPTMHQYKDSGFAFSKDAYKPVKATSPMFGIDCEMCLTCTYAHELGSVSIVNEDSKLIYHKLVKPKNRIVNYLTRYSGLTPEMFRDVTTTLKDVQRDLSELLPKDAILVGHSLPNDLKALKMLHPYVIDSAVAYNLRYKRNSPSSLKSLTKLFLKKDIQTGRSGHDPTEDAAASLELIKLKLSKGFAFGNVLEGYEMNSIDLANCMNNSYVQDLDVTTSENFSNLFQHTAASKLKTAVLMTPSSAKSCQDILNSVPGERLDLQLKKGNKDLSKKAADIAMSKDFTYLHMKIPQAKVVKTKKFIRTQLLKLDKRLHRIFKGACQRAFLMYVFRSSPNDLSNGTSHNGLVMLGVKGVEELSSSDCDS